ncbi:winged helix-turn-helix transcriptional regulator [Nonomuraea jabiensis]|uniref:winged helix-turn-helix transcriptional regulator n=1 Tax=Nonomuraea jabiensis TaxID=882448 RepID=UPI0036AD3BB0
MAKTLMAALDLFGRRWTLRIVWELHEGSSGFRPLQQRCDGMSSSVLRQRLLELTEAGLVTQLGDSRYALTPLGEDAYQSLSPLVHWSARWAAALGEQSDEAP